jgi:hypothetical protein
METKTLSTIANTKRVVMLSVIVLLIVVGFKVWDKYGNDTTENVQVINDSEDSVDLLPGRIPRR